MGAAPPHILAGWKREAEPVLPYNGRDDERETGGYPVPRCRRGQCTAKIRAVMGLRVEIFRAQRRKYYPALDRLDRWSGLVATHPGYVGACSASLKDSHINRTASLKP